MTWDEKVAKGYQWNTDENRGETDAEFQARMAQQKSERAEAEKSKAKKAATEYKPEDFKYQSSNEYINAQKRMLDQAETKKGQTIASSLASRGVTQSGHTERAIARGAQEQGAQLANIAGNDYLRQFQEYQSAEKDKYQRLMNNYNIESEDYNQYLSQFYNNLALVQAEADRKYQQEMQKPNAGSILGGAISGASVGSSLGPWGTLGGAVIGGIAGAF